MKITMLILVITMLMFFSTPRYLCNPGEPVIPADPAQAILPNGHIVEEIIVTPVKTVILEGNHFLT